MGKIYSRLVVRPIRTFNVVHRTEKIISKEKPTPAPQYPSTKKQKELVDQMYPDFMKKHYKKDMKLDKYLKSVYVVADNPKQPVASTRPLPKDKSSTPIPEFGYYEANNIPEGKCSLRQAFTFINQHKENPAEYSVEKIALQYKLDKEVVKNILKYFHTPSVMNLAEKRKELESKKELQK